MNRTAAIGLFLLGMWAFSHAQRKNDSPQVFYVKWLPFGFTALSVPPFGIFILEKHRGADNLVVHELVHWKQYQREGLARFLANYAASHFKHGYDLNPYEIEARFNESDFCKLNYTYCVREGLSDTVHNPEFRQVYFS